MRAVRILISLVLGAAVTFALFLLMNALISNDAGEPEDREPATIRFGEAEVPETVQQRERERPEEPPPPDEPPPPPERTISEVQQEVQPMPQMDMPNLDVPFSGSGPSLGPMGQQDLSQDGGIVPLVRIQPQYPRRAMVAGIEGYVTLEFTITETGSVTDVSVVEARPPRVFDREAIRAIMRWRFKPKVVDGQPVVQPNVTQTLDFNLDGAQI
jgi:protein TonB